MIIPNIEILRNIIISTYIYEIMINYVECIRKLIQSIGLEEETIFMIFNVSFLQKKKCLTNNIIKISILIMKISF